MLEKSAEAATLEILEDQSTIVIELTCRAAVQKTFTTRFLETERLKAQCFPSGGDGSAGNRFCVHSRVLTEAVLNFLLNQEEVTMIAGPRNFTIKNYVDVYDPDEADKKGAVHTVLTIQSGGCSNS